MKNKILLGICCTILCQCSSLMAMDYTSISKTINPSSLQHPYLFFNNHNKQAIIQHIENDPVAAETWKTIQVTARRYLLTLPSEEPERTINNVNARFIGANPYRAYQNYYANGAMTCAFVYQITGDKEYAEKAYYLADKLCLLDTWVQGAHYFENMYTRVWPWGVKDDQVVFSYDITTADYACDMAYVYDWIYDAITKAQRDRIRGALLEKAILRVRGNWEYHWWATAYSCNWSGICHTGVGIAAMSLLTEDPHLMDVIVRSAEGVEGMINQMDQDGGWAEGRGYWEFGMRQSVFFMSAMKNITGGKINMFNIEKINKYPADFLLFGLTGSFNDGGGSGAPIGSTSMYNKLVSETKNTTAMWYLENYLRRNRRMSRASMWDLIWAPPTDVQAIKPAEASRLFRGIGWAFLRKDFGDQYMQVATKAGKADDPHHGHLDIGTVNLTWQGESVVGEFQQGAYDLFVFNDVRWDYLHVQSHGHNVVMVDDIEQVIQKRKDQPWNTSYEGTIHLFESNPQIAYTMMDNTNAYPENSSMKLWRRWIILDKETNIVIILDKVGAPLGAKINVLYHPNVPMSITDNVVSLNGAISKMEMRALFNGDYTLRNGHQLHYQIVQNNHTHWIPYFCTQVIAPKEVNYIGSVFYPTDIKDSNLGASQFTLDESGPTPVITCVANGKTVKYVISNQSVKVM